MRHHSRFILFSFFVLAVCGAMIFVVTQSSIPFISYKKIAHNRLIDCSAKDKNDHERCASRAIDSLLDTGGVDVAMEELAQGIRSDAQFASSCHALAHQIGQRAYQMFAQKKEIAITPKITYCSYGFYHGFMETAVQMNGNYSQIANFCHYINEQLKLTGLDPLAECYHGIGHGVVTEHTSVSTKGDAKDLARRSLALCERVTELSGERRDCASGVFNGIANFYTAGEYGLTMDKHDPASLCKEQPLYVKHICYAFMARVYLALAKGNFSEAMALAGNTAEYDGMDALVSNAAVLYAMRFLTDDPNPLVSSCHSLAQTLHVSCMKGAVIGLVQASPPDQEVQIASRLCRLASLSDEEKNSCIRELIIELKKMYTRQQLETVCNTSNDINRSTCMSLVR